jgi:hypothetical protein
MTHIMKDDYCPLIDEEVEGCNTLNLTNMNLEKASKYCLGNYQVCKVYVHHMNKKRAKQVQQEG